MAAAVRRGAFLCAPSQASAPQGAPPHGGGGSAFNGAFGGEGGFIAVGLVAEAPTDAAGCGGAIPIRRLHSRSSSLSISGCVCVATRSFVSHQLEYRHISSPHGPAQGALSVGTDEAVCLPFESHGPAPTVANKGGTKDSSDEAKISGSAAAHSSGATAGGLASSSAPPFIGDDGRGGLGVEVKYTWLQRMACSAPVAGAPPSEPTSPKTSGMRAALLVSVAMLLVVSPTAVAAAGVEGERDRAIARNRSIGSAVLPPRLIVAGDADEAGGDALVVVTRDVAAPAPVTAASASARRLSSGDAVSWSYHEISTAADGARSVFGIDLDGDGDVDVLSASEYDDTIAWYENLDGSGGSWSYHEIYTAADGASRCLGSTSTVMVTSTCSRPRVTTTRSRGTRTSTGAAGAGATTRSIPRRTARFGVWDRPRR